jgi:hypothetical protein
MMMIRMMRVMMKTLPDVGISASCKNYDQAFHMMIPKAKRTCICADDGRHVGACRLANKEVEARRAEIQASLVRTAPVLAARIAKTGAVKEHSEKAVSALSAGR